MRVIMLHYAAPPVVGGVERVIYHHATLLAGAGHEVHVVAGRGEPFAPGVAFHHLPEVDSRHPEVLALKAELDAGRVPPGLAALAARLEGCLRQIVRAGDVLIAHNVLSLHKNLALTEALHRLAAGPDAPRLVAWHHDLAWRAARYQSEVHAGYPWDLLRQSPPGVRHVAVSEARRRDVAALFGLPLEDIAVVPGGVDVAAFYRLSPPLQELLERLGLLEAWPCLLLPARITRRKNIELAVRLLAPLRVGGFPQAMLVVTGPPGPHNPENWRYFEELHALRRSLGLEDAAHFLADHLPGGPDDAAMLGLYQVADALLLPSLEEGFGLPLLEAALLRLPVFCSDIPPLRELAGQHATYFSPHAAPEAVADCIGRVLSADRAALLRRKARQRYDWRRIVHDHVVPLLS